MKGTLYVLRTRAGRPIKKPALLTVSGLVCNLQREAYAWVSDDKMATDPLYHTEVEIVRDGIFVRGLEKHGRDLQTYIYQEWFFKPDGEG